MAVSTATMVRLPPTADPLLGDSELAFQRYEPFASACSNIGVRVCIYHSPQLAQPFGLVPGPRPVQVDETVRSVDVVFRRDVRQPLHATKELLRFLVHLRFEANFGRPQAGLRLIRRIGDDSFVGRQRARDVPTH